MQQKKDNQVFHFVTVGIVKLLWRFSRSAVLLFIFPTWLCLFSQLWIVIGLSISDVAFATGFYCLAGLCFLLMLGSLWLGFRAAQGFCRIVALAQCIVATAFSLIASCRNIFDITGRICALDSVESILTLFAMLVFFIVTVIGDTARLFMEQRAME